MLLLVNLTEDWEGKKRETEKKQNVEWDILGLVVPSHENDGRPLAERVEHWVVRSIVLSFTVYECSSCALITVGREEPNIVMLQSPVGS